jgi:hypothetical protein
VDINSIAALLVIFNIAFALASNADIRDKKRRIEALLVRLEGLRGKLQEVLERGKVVRSTRAMLTRLRDSKEEELLALQKELDAFEESAQNKEEGDEEETDSESEETHHDKDIGISKGITGSQTEEVDFKAPKKIHVRSQGKRDS